MSYSTGPLANSAEFVSNNPLSALLGWSLHKNGRRHDGGLSSLNTSFFHGSSNQALWNIHTAVSPSGIDTEWEASQEFLPPLTQLITKCKRRTKITRKIKRSKQSHCYNPNSVATDGLVLAGWWRGNKSLSWWRKHELEGKSQCKILQSRRVV